MVASMLLPRFEFEAPTTLDEACQILHAHRAQARVLAGGTDLLVKMKRGVASPARVVSLARLAELRSVDVGDKLVRIGALSTMSALAAHATLGTTLHALVEGAGSVGGPNIRNRATVGGNVVNARPCADTLPPLIVLDAQLVLLSQRGERRCPVDGFVTGAGETNIADDEILTQFELLQRPHTGSCYLKITRRAAVEVTCVGCAAAVTLSADGKQVERARIALTSVAPIPLRVAEAEAAIEGQAPAEQAYASAGAAARKSCWPIDDHRASAAYRDEMVQVLTVRALRQAVARAQGAS